jgi:hypothetical protein
MSEQPIVKYPIKAFVLMMLVSGPKRREDIIAEVLEIPGATRAAAESSLESLYYAGFFERYTSGTHFLSEKAKDKIIPFLATLEL